MNRPISIYVRFEILRDGRPSGFRLREEARARILGIIHIETGTWNSKLGTFGDGRESLGGLDSCGYWGMGPQVVEKFSYRQGLLATYHVTVTKLRM
jgi:hypothetical protein